MVFLVNLGSTRFLDNNQGKTTIGIMTRSTRFLGNSMKSLAASTKINSQQITAKTLDLNTVEDWMVDFSRIL